MRLGMLALCTLLAVDLGNTTTRLGAFLDEELLGTWDITTPAALTADEAFSHISHALAILGVAAPSEAILASVVPSLDGRVAHGAVPRLRGGRVYVVGPGLKSGLRMRIDDPSEVGADRVADAVAARDAYGSPVVVVDLGTTTNIEVIDGGGAFAGGAIAPGVALGARSLCGSGGPACR